MGIGTYINLPAVTGKRPRVLGVDIPLLLAVIALGVFGLLMVYSASWDYSSYWYKDSSYMITRQVIFMLVGAIGAFLLACLDYHIWRKYAIYLMAFTILLLFGVLIINEIQLGSARSLYSGSIRPSEFAKVVTIIYLSVWLYSKREQMHDIQLGLIPLATILGFVGGLIFLQQDLSAAATIFALGGLLFFLAGGDLRQIVLFLVVALVAGFLVVQFTKTGHNRIETYINGLKNPLDADYQVRRSLQAIILGKGFGVGLGNSSQKLTGLPVAPLDSIFAVIVEEFGLVGAIGTVSLYGILLWRGLKIASRAPDSLGSLLAAGCTFWIVMEALINMGMLIRIFPIAGNALPFISFGGSSLVSVFAAIGILFNISRQSAALAPAARERSSYSATVDLRRRDRRRSVSRPRRSAGNRG